MTASAWWRLLGKQATRIDPACWPRLPLGIAITALNSLVALVERGIWSRAIARTRVAEPLFVIGHWRSGTTHLHNMLAQDERFFAPNTFQVFNPHVFFLTEGIRRPIERFLVPPKRPMDNMKIALNEPQEDEFALLILCGCSPYLGFSFPRDQERFDRYLRMRDVTSADLKRWTDAMIWLARKLTIRGGGRPLILKSPPHTARLRLLSELFPDARFVHIHRNPYDVFRSTRHTWKKLHPWFRLQILDERVLDETVLRQYRLMHEAYFADRALLPRGRLVEVAFNELTRDPVGTLRSVYERLGLPPFAAAEPGVVKYLDSLGEYRLNRFEELPPEMAERLACEWRQAFETWGYGPADAADPKRACFGTSRGRTRQ